MSTVLLGPAIAFLVFRGWRTNLISGRSVLPLILALTLPLSLYLYLPWRYSADAMPYVLGHYNNLGELVRVDHTTFGGLWQTVTAQQFESLIFAYGPLGYLGQLGDAAYWLFGNFLGLGVLLGVLGLAANLKNDRPRFIFLGLVFVSNILFFAGYGSIDKQVMFLLAFFCWAIWMGEGLEYIVGLIKRRRAGVHGSSGRRWAVRDIAAGHWEKLVLALPVAVLIINFSFVDVSSDTSVRDRSAALLESFEPGSLVFARWPDEAPMSYLQIVEKQRPDVQVIDRFLISRPDKALLIERNLGNRPVYVFGPVPALNIEHRSAAVKGGVDQGHRFFRWAD